MTPKIKNDWNTLERSSPEVIVALDACEQGRPDAHKLLAGVPCSECYVNDRYAATIVYATPSLHTIIVARLHEGEFSHRDPNYWDRDDSPIEKPLPSVVYSYSEIDRTTYRWSEKHQQYRAKQGTKLWIGVAENYRPLEA